MFRIKNVRNSTVAKQHNISPSINRQPQQLPPQRQPTSHLSRDHKRTPHLKVGQ